MFGDRDHDRRVAEGAVGVGVAAGILGAAIWLGMLNGYYALFRRFPKSTGFVTLLLLLALIFHRQVGYAVNWLELDEQLPDGRYAFELHDSQKKKVTSLPQLMLVKDGKISRDGGKTFEEVIWERDIKNGTIDMIIGKSRFAFYGGNNEDDQNSYHVQMRDADEKDRRPAGSGFDRYAMTSAEQSAAQARDLQRRVR